MNHAQWNAKQVKETNFSNLKSRYSKISQPLMFNEPILNKINREKPAFAQADKTLPFTASVKKVLEEDDRQLDLLCN